MQIIGCVWEPDDRRMLQEPKDVALLTELVVGLSLVAVSLVSCPEHLYSNPELESVIPVP